MEDFGWNTSSASPFMEHKKCSLGLGHLLYTIQNCSNSHFLSQRQRQFKLFRARQFSQTFSNSNSPTTTFCLNKLNQLKNKQSGLDEFCPNLMNWIFPLYIFYIVFFIVFFLNNCLSSKIIFLIIGLEKFPLGKTIFDLFFHLWNNWLWEIATGQIFEFTIYFWVRPTMALFFKQIK